MKSINFHAFVEGITGLLDIRDKYTKGHSDRVAEFASVIAKRMKFCEEEIEFIHIAAHLHDIGKVGIPDRILNKTSKLEDEEYKIIKTHPVLGYDVLKNIEGCKEIADTIRWHHERWDGKGYPDGKKGEEIPIMSRIIAVVDVYDAITSDRIYRNKLRNGDAILELEKSKWTQLDGDIVDILIEEIKSGNKVFEENI